METSINNAFLVFRGFESLQNQLMTDIKTFAHKKFCLFHKF